MTRKPDELGEQIRAIREEVVMKTLSVTLIAGSVLLLGNMARNLHLGNPLSIVHPLLYLVALTFYLTRRRIGAQRIAWLTVILLYLAATAGMLVYGLAGNSAAVYMAFCFVSTTFFGVRGGAAAAALSVGSMALIGGMLVGGRISMDVDLPAFMLNPFSWVAAVLTVGSMSWLVLSQVGRLNDRYMKLLGEQHHQARHDSLTGLNNRMALESVLDQAIADALRENLGLAVILLDLDRFKNINDSLGHNVGDHLLVEVASRLQVCVRGADTVARLSGDEFVVLLPRLASPDVTSVAAKLVEALSAPYWIGDRELRTTPSIGISLCPQDAQDVESLIKYADTAMYAAKAKGGARFQYFAREMNQAATERLHIEYRLRAALDGGQFVLHYQPKIDMTGRLTGLEALLRWQVEGEAHAGAGAVHRDRRGERTDRRDRRLGHHDRLPAIARLDRSGTRCAVRRDQPVDAAVAPARPGRESGSHARRFGVVTGHAGIRGDRNGSDGKPADRRPPSRRTRRDGTDAEHR